MGKGQKRKEKHVRARTGLELWKIIWRREWVWRRPGGGEDGGAGVGSEFVVSPVGLLRPRPSWRIAS